MIAAAVSGLLQSLETQSSMVCPTDSRSTMEDTREDDRLPRHNLDLKQMSEKKNNHRALERLHLSSSPASLRTSSTSFSSACDGNVLEISEISHTAPKLVTLHSQQDPPVSWELWARL